MNKFPVGNYDKSLKILTREINRQKNNPTNATQNAN